MERIFENLYESVSETCFEDIVSMVEAYINELEADTIKSLQAKRERDSTVARWKRFMLLSSPKRKNVNKSERDKVISNALEADRKLDKTRKAIGKWALRHPEVPSEKMYDEYYGNQFTKLINEPKYSNEKPDPKTLVYKH